MNFPDLLNRFSRYVEIDTQSDDASDSFPSTEKQFDLARLLEKELTEMGLDSVQVNRWCYVSASLKTNQQANMPTVALIAHLDTSPDVSGKNVSIQTHPDYAGGDLVINREKGITIKAAENPLLSERTGETILTSDGTTLLGADDKAGIAEIMAAIKYLVEHPEAPRPNIRVLFTPDEEIGRGTEKLTREDIGADAAYTMDGERLGEIEDETFCADTVEIKVNGVNVHPGYAKGKLVNAVKVAGRILEKLPKNNMSPETTEKREGYIHPHQVSGGVEQAELKFLIRDFDESGLKMKEQVLQEIIDSTAKEYPGARIDRKIIESYRNMKVVLDKHPDVIEKAVKAIEMAGIKPVRNLIRGGTDGARISFMGIPTPNIFTGGSNFHSRTEWISLENMQKASEVIVHLMEQWTR